MRLGLLLCLLAGGAWPAVAQDSTDAKRDEGEHRSQRWMAGGEHWRVRIPRRDIERLHRWRDHRLGWPRELGRVHWRNQGWQSPQSVWDRDRVYQRLDRVRERARRQGEELRVRRDALGDVLREEGRAGREMLRQELRARHESQRNLLRDRAALERHRLRDWSRFESKRRYRAI